MQRGLFDQQNTARILYYSHLNNLDIPAALSQLALFEFEKTEYIKTEALQKLHQAIVPLKEGTCTQLADFLENDLGQYLTGALQEDEPWIRKGLTTQIIQRYDASTTRYFSAVLHPAELLTRMEMYKESNDLIFQAIHDHGEDAWLRQLQSVNFHQLGQEKKARQFLTMALFFDPISCREEWLIDEAVKETWESVITNKSDAKAKVELAYQLWRKKIIVLETNNPIYIDALKSAVQTQPSDNARDQHDPVRFLQLMVMAEWHRINDEDILAITRIRQQMKALDPLLFSDYMAQLV